jgi:hypothetical protein
MQLKLSAYMLPHLNTELAHSPFELLWATKSIIIHKLEAVEWRRTFEQIKCELEGTSMCKFPATRFTIK